MKKVIFKTIFVSIVAFISFAMSLMGILTISAPRTFSKFYQSLGLTKLSVATSDIYYKNSLDINDQFYMFNNALNAKDFELTKNYAKKLLEHKHLDNFVMFLNEQNPNNVFLQNEKNRIYKNYVLAIYNTKHKNSAAQIAFDLLENNEINVKFCFAVDALPRTYKFSLEQKEAIKQKYNDLLGFFKDQDAGLDKGVIAVRLSEMLDVILRFEKQETYQQDFNLIKAELEKW